MTEQRQPTLDDYPAAHIPPVAMWSENYAFMINDAANGLAVATQLGRWPVDARIWREFFMIGLPGERVLYHKAFGRAATAQVASASLFSIEVLEPGEEFRLTFEGPVAEDTRANLLARGVTVRPVRPLKMELHMRGVVPVWDMSGHANEAEALAGKMHIEQVGEVNGFIAYGDERYQISKAFGQRDHSRGVRIITQLYRHCWAQGWFPEEELTFNVFKMVVHGGKQPMSNASISKSGRRYPARLKSVDLMEGPDDHARRYSIVLDSELGEMSFNMSRITVSLPAAFTSPYDKSPGAIPGFHAASSNEEAVIWEWRGREGMGWSERSFNASPFPG